MAETKFKKGEEVEVTFKEEGLRGAWFTGTVLKPAIRKKIYIEYHDLIKEGTEDTKLREYVDVINVRPLAPRDMHRTFKLHDEVDAYHNDAWWEGDITRVLEQRGVKRFVVYFRVSREELDFAPVDLRIHREWSNGCWIPPMEEEQQGTPSMSGADQTNESSKLMAELSKGTPSKSGADQTKESPKLVAKLSKGTSSKSGADQTKESTELVLKLSKRTPSKSGADQTKESPKLVAKLSKGTSSKSGADQTNESSKLKLSKRTPSKSGAVHSEESSKPVVKFSKGTPSKYGTDQNEESSKPVVKPSKGTPSKPGTDQNDEASEPVVKFIKGAPSKSGTDQNEELSKPMVRLSKGTPSKPGTDQNDEASEPVVKFSNGTRVEVSSNEKGFVGAWFVAIVVETRGENKFLVEHQNLMTDDETELLKEEVDSLHIRPSPPEIPKDQFKKLEEVDALYNDAWWVGVISKVVDGPKPRYIVYFKDSNEELEFKHSELRPHQDWIKGEWIRSSKAFEDMTTEQTEEVTPDNTE